MATQHAKVRQLAVILHADVAGSTALVQLDEAVAHERITAAFARFSDVINRYHGLVHEVRGDALVAEFSRASDAVAAALVFQQTNTDRNAEMSDGLAPAVRVGISLAEVVIADHTVTGPGVVLAQRVEQLAEPGGLCITAAIHEAVPGRFPFAYEALGAQLLKGFDEPVRALSVSLIPDAKVPAPEEVPRRRSQGAALRWTTAALVIVVASAIWMLVRHTPPADPPPSGELPAIAVLPFENLSAASDQMYFSDGITEDIITDLSQLAGLTVATRNASFAYRGPAMDVADVAQKLQVDYVLTGSVRRAGDRLRISVQLLDARSAERIFAERYDAVLTDVFVVQDDITGRIVRKLSVSLTGSEQSRLTRNPTANFEAYDTFLQGRRFYNQFDREGFERAEEAYRRAIALDPRFARAYGALAITLVDGTLYDRQESMVETTNRALELARTATELDEGSPQAHWALGYVHRHRGQFQHAEAALRRALELAPNDGDTYALLALIANAQGQGRQAIELIRRAMALNPHYNWGYPYNLGRGHYHAADYEAAVEPLQNAIERNPGVVYPRLFLASALQRLGRTDDAEWEVEQIMMMDESFTASRLNEALGWRDDIMGQLLEDLRAAGLQE